jgi:hypothetical protein
MDIAPPDEDSGAFITEAIDGTSIFGGSHERQLPYDVRQFHREPPLAAYNTGMINSGGTHNTCDLCGS